MGPNRIITVVNPDNSNGAALLHDVGLLRRPRTKAVAINSVAVSATHSLDRRGSLVHRLHRRIKFIFRGFGLFPRHAILRGVVRKPIVIGNRPGRRTATHTHRLLTGIKLTNGRADCPHHLSNNRRRHITVTHTLTVHPRIVLFSRPASTLSPRLINRILGAVHRLTRRGHAVIVIARRVDFTQSITSQTVFVSRKQVIRRKTTGTLFTSPRRPHAHRFLRGFLLRWWRGVDPSSSPIKTKHRFGHSGATWRVDVARWWRGEVQ